MSKISINTQEYLVHYVQGSTLRIYFKELNTISIEYASPEDAQQAWEQVDGQILSQ